MKNKKLDYWLKANDFNQLHRLSIIKQKELWAADWVDRKDLYWFINIKHHDGSEFKLHYSFLRWGQIYGKGSWRPEMLIAITEHNGILCFYLDDLEYINIQKTNKSKERKVLKMIEPKDGEVSTYKIYKYE